MTVELTDKVSVVQRKLYDLLFANREPLRLEGVYLGEQQSVGPVPCVSVEPGVFNRELGGAPMYMHNYMRTIVTVYGGDLTVSQGEVEVLTMERAEAIDDFFRGYQTLEGLVVYGYFESIEPGYSNVNNVWTRSVRMTWYSYTKKQL